MRKNILNPDQLLKLPQDWVKEQIHQFLQEDAPAGDLTTAGLPNQAREVTGQLEAASEMIFAGQQILDACFGEQCVVNCHFEDGAQVLPGEIIAEVQGPAGAILTRERITLNLLQRLCGIATTTRQYAKILEPYDMVVLDTRKTTPGLRLFEKYAVAAGGGQNHRLNLSSGVLIKDNHLQLTSSIGDLVGNIRTANPQMVIELEVEDIDQLHAGLEAGCNAFLLDNMEPDKAAKFVRAIRDYPGGESIFVEASGGITLENLASYSDTGIDGISVGALTHHIVSADIRLEIRLED
ncbi:carboxylating nicotinate-nucleotide diphosphorylase [Candidatus Neomarinimicrobiota bacterium]